MTMRRRADLVLISLAAAFAASLALMCAVGEPVWLLLVQAVLEGALVGSAADWFAVRALFEAPLGYTKHTRLVPKNRARLLRAIADGVQKQVLPRSVIRSRMAEARLVPFFIETAENYGIERALDKLWSRYVSAQGIGEKGADYLLARADRLTVSSILSETMVSRLSGQVLAWASEKVRSEAVRGWIEQQLEKVIDEKADEAGVLGKLFAFFGKASGTVDAHAASVAVVRAVAKELQSAAADEHHTLRVWLSSEFCKVLGRLDEKDIVRTVLAYPRLGTLLREAVDCAARDGEAAGRRFFLSEGRRCWDILTANAALKTEIEAKLHWAIYRFVETRGYLIGEVIERTLERYSEDEMRVFIEEKVGDDLEWIRMNGAILGGILGLVFFLVMYGLGITLG